MCADATNLSQIDFNIGQSDWREDRYSPRTGAIRWNRIEPSEVAQYDRTRYWPVDTMSPGGRSISPLTGGHALQSVTVDICRSQILRSTFARCHSCRSSVCTVGDWLSVEVGAVLVRKLGERTGVWIQLILQSGNGATKYIAQYQSPLFRGRS